MAKQPLLQAYDDHVATLGVGVRATVACSPWCSPSPPVMPCTCPRGVRPSSWLHVAPCLGLMGLDGGKRSPRYRAGYRADRGYTVQQTAVLAASVRARAGNSEYGRTSLASRTVDIL